MLLRFRVYNWIKSSFITPSGIIIANFLEVFTLKVVLFKTEELNAKVKSIMSVNMLYLPPYCCSRSVIRCAIYTNSHIH